MDRVLWLLLSCVAGIASVVVATASGEGSHDPPRCRGQAATIVGSPERDELFGTRRRDVIVGLRGGDDIYGVQSRDLLCGNEGADHFSGGNGDDVVMGGRGDDSLSGEDGDDELHGGSGSDFIGGRRGSNRAFGGQGADVLSGRGLIRGGVGRDELFGGYGGAELDGGPGRDVVKTGHLNGRPAISVLVDLEAGVLARSGRPNDTLISIRDIHGREGQDLLFGDDRANILLAGVEGPDRIRGRGGNDFIRGSLDEDRLFGGSGDDEIRGDYGPSGTVFGDDFLDGGAGFDSLDGREGTDTCFNGELVENCEAP